MKIIKDAAATHNRKRRITIELDSDEDIISIRNKSYYRLGGQVDDIVHSHVLTEMLAVYWCSVTQRWEEA